jgi:hypothetical protein
MSVAGTVETLPPAALREAVAALWWLPPPGPRNLFSAPEFVRLRDTCASLYPNARPGPFALHNALEALGVPCRPPPAAPDLAVASGNLRCLIVHGRKMDAPISGEARLRARRLARRVVHKLVEDALEHPLRESREAYLNALGE